MGEETCVLCGREASVRLLASVAAMTAALCGGKLCR